ncbi:MAG: site-2 protease family protein [Calditrichaeota bacterium]|nr:site-2 protease family protein [Calditrichota bacterium]
MYSKRRAEIADDVINNRLKKDRWARLYGLLVYKQKRDRISEEEVKELQQHLLTRGLYSQAEASPTKYYLRIISSDRVPKKNQVFIPVLLFLLTIITTSFTGALLGGLDPLLSWENFSYGFYYSFALLTILFCHEMGHYLYARYYAINVTLPYFLPFYFPLMFSFGTFGAFIRLKAPIPNKKALFDIGIAGPIAGFVVSVAFLIIGFLNIPSEQAMWDFISNIHPISEDSAGVLTFGSNLLFDILAWITGRTYLPMSEMYHFPFIVAGWFGLLVTALNLMPIGQLDGGHITYALFGSGAERIAILGFTGIIILNIVLISRFQSFVYVLWPLLILIFIRFKHPPTLDDSMEIDKRRRILGYFAYIIFILSFSPMPMYLQ